MNKLDLIFEKEPPQVQRKLMNLLIQYNAIMQYNKDDDKFQVDLLLPFKTRQQKQEFIQNFKSRPHPKQQHTRQQDSQNQIRNRNSTRRLRSQSSSHQIYNSASQKVVQCHDKSELSSQIAKQNMHSNNYEQQQISLDFTNEQENSRVSHTFNIKDLSIKIQSKLKNAVKEIQSQSMLIKSHGNTIQNYEQISQYSQPYQQGTIRLEKIQVDHETNEQNQQYEEVQNQESNTFLKQYDTPKYSNSTKKQNRKNMSYFNQQSNTSSQKYNEIKIQQHQQFQNKQYPKKVSVENYRSNHENKNIIRPKGYDDEDIWIQNDDQQLFQNDKKYKQYNKQMDKLQNNAEQYKTVTMGQQNQYYKNKQKQRQILIHDQQKSKSVKQSLANKYKTRKPSQVNVTSVRERYTQFMKKSHKEMEKIYENIRKDIKRNDKQLRKSRRQDPILVLQQNIRENHSQQQKIFKQQIIKDYQRRIIVQNKYMSSQDLVRYFKYLLQHAKNLYIKQLRKGR